jgi:hypothetical protein
MAKAPLPARSNDPTGQALIKQIARAISGWLTFQQSAKRHRTYNEYLIYLPIFEVADGQKWDVYPQFAINPAVRRRGAPETVDFVFCLRSEQGVLQRAVILEVKLIKPRKRYTQLFSKDALKMTRLNENIIAEVLGLTLKQTYKKGDIQRWLLIASQENQAIERFSRGDENADLEQQANDIWDASIMPTRPIFPNGVPWLADTNLPLDAQVGLLRVGDASFSSRFKVLALREQAVWKSMVLKP